MSLEIFNDQCGKSTVINQLGESKLWKSGNVDVYSIDFNNRPYDLTHYAYRAIVVMIIWYTCIWIYSVPIANVVCLIPTNGDVMLI
jgi:hypothetical protein